MTYLTAAIMVCDCEFLYVLFSVEINQSTLKNALIPEIKKVLVERINPDFGILDNLLASKALSRSEFTKVTNLSGPDAKNSLLLELATENEKLTELFNALKDTNQEHLVNYATAKGGLLR